MLKLALTQSLCQSSNIADLANDHSPLEIGLNAPLLTKSLVIEAISELESSFSRAFHFTTNGPTFICCILYTLNRTICAVATSLPHTADTPRTRYPAHSFFSGDSSNLVPLFFSICLHSSHFDRTSFIYIARIVIPRSNHFVTLRRLHPGLINSFRTSRDSRRPVPE